MKKKKKKNAQCRAIRPDVCDFLTALNQMSRLKKELMLACEERDNHQLDKELLTNRLRHLEEELEASKNSVNEKTRESRLLEVKRMHPLRREIRGK